MLDRWLAFKQLVEGSVPLLELAQFDLHPRRPAGFAPGLVAPLRHPSPAVAIAHEVGLQPTRQPMLAAGRGEAIDHQQQSPIAQHADIAMAALAQPVERRLQPELAPQVARHQHRSPIPCRDRLHLIGPDVAGGGGSDRLAVQQARQLAEVEMRRQHVAATEIENGAMPGLALLAKGFDHAHVLVRHPGAAAGANHAQEHGFSDNLSRRIATRNQAAARGKSVDFRQFLSLRFRENPGKTASGSSKINGVNSARRT